MDSDKNFSTPPRAKFTKKGLSIPPTPFLDCLGRGTGVNVWSLNNPAIKSPWAVKNVRNAMQNECKARYQSLIDKEASVLRNIHHENIIGFRGFVTSVDGRHCLAMETCGRSLGDLVEERFESQGGPFTPTEILKVVRCIANALDYLHIEKKLMHGDIKPGNILVKGDFDVVKLCDLGVCVEIRENGCAGDYTGTLIYNAPEVLNEGVDEVPVTTKAEIFSLGLVIWEMIALVPPHCDALNDSVNECSDDSILSDTSFFAEGVLGTRPALPENLPEDYKPVVDIFIACTENDPKKRPSANDLVLIDSM